MYECFYLFVPIGKCFAKMDYGFKTIEGIFNRVLSLHSLIHYFYQKYRQHISKALMILLFTFYCLLSVSRIFALYLNYHAPLDIYESLRIPGSNNINTTLALDDTEISLCVGKEWYRFPGHYFLVNVKILVYIFPFQPKGVRLRFLKSDFNGQLPKYFIESTNDENTPELSQWFNRKDGSWMMPTSMNDLNLEETDRYVFLYKILSLSFFYILGQC